ncbi:membrane protein insertase YidC [Pseudoflavonifractor sp. An85]|uniref:membrane protein insertase YidC n=1 Tax=Pseudoflavonifractor sp. An85 TaxID=1965661 RepID=UPI000B376208|nr:membrane protein insertase YidC [Pseudoflavonifractor sp. An85]OUN24416.1 hypothetical protein B5G37_07330 [Pseudoflavonifractor sp. An85]
MDIWQILMTPFSWLLKNLCILFDSYGIALIVFTLVVKIILFPLSLKGKKSMIKTTMVSSQVKEIQQRCGNDRERYNRELQKFYEENDISPMGGCGWSLIPLAILMPLYAIIRRPLKYLMGLTDAGTTAVANALGVAGFQAGSGFGELTLAAQMNAGNLSATQQAVTAAGLSAGGMFVINFNFLGLDLAQIPSLMFWKDGITLSEVGLFLLPIISAGLSLLSMMVSQRTNQMNANQNNQNASMRSMMIVSPLISLWIGFTLPAGLCVYWIANSLFMMVQEVICGKILKKDYEAAQREMEAMALKAKEAEKERRRQAAQRKAEAIASGKAKKGQHMQKKEKGVDVSASREGMRTYARGRAYDPNRYPITPYVDPNPSHQSVEEPVEEQEDVVDKPTTQVVPPVSTPVEPETTQVAEVEEQAGDYEEAYAPESEDSNPKG